MGLKEALSVRFDQVVLLSKKNYALAKRGVRATVTQITVPFLFVLVLFVLQFAIKANESNSEVLKAERVTPRVNVLPYPRCILSRVSRGPCVSLIYTVAPPDEKPLVDLLVSEIQSTYRIPASEIRYFTTPLEQNDYLNRNRNSTQGGYIFNVTRSSSGQVHVDYIIQYNQTETTSFGRPIDPVQYTAVPLQYALEQAMFAVLGGTREANIDLVAFAHPEALPYDVIGDAGPGFFFASLMFNFVIALGRIVAEREDKLREGMNQMGLKSSAYWISWMLYGIVFAVASVITLILSGLIFQFRFFLKNDFRTYFVLFLLFALAMVPMAFALSTLVRRAKTANSLGFSIFLLGLIIQIFQELIYADTTADFWKALFSLLPFVLLAKGIKDISNKSASVASPGMRWSERGSNASFPLTRVYGWLIADFFIYSFLTWYLDNTVKSQYGIARPFYFCFTPSYWSGHPVKRSHDRAAEAAEGEDDDEQHVGLDDEGVQEEQRMAETDSYPADAAVRLYRIRKTFIKRGCCGCRKTTFTAIRGLSFHVDSNSLFCLLGHNGAGKSTLFNILTGLFGGQGDGKIFDYDLETQMSSIRSVMGVCPQHDVLWPDLTGREHLALFCALKGMARDEIAAEVEARLSDVDLIADGNGVVATYSGGMKRRLSTAIAFCSNPKIVFLDEPTTGMDPVSRRKVWNMIQAKKPGRAIVLTTHSMEEADILGDRIGIVSHGRLSTIGTSLRLKNKFGAGYGVTLVTSDADTGPAAALVAKELDGLAPAATADRSLQYVVPRELLGKLPAFFRAVRKRGKAAGIKDTQIAMTTLESVFIRVAELEVADDEVKKRLLQARGQASASSSSSNSEEDEVIA